MTWCRRLGWIVLAVLTSQVTALINGWSWLPAGAWLRHVMNRSVERLPERDLPDGRLLFVAPHPDDEALAAGGLISERTRQGHPVFVAYVTMGDGFPLDTVLLTHTLPVRHADNQALGLARQQEALRASQLLGVPRAQVTFLGFPDRGLNALMSTHFDQPFTSRYTGVQQNPYPDTWRPGAEYSGAELLEQLQAVVAWASPDVILWPDGHDRHPDHRAVHTLMTKVSPALTGVRHWTYLVHGSLEWPLPKGHHPAWPLVPPLLIHLQPGWSYLRLTPMATAKKLAAIMAYPSQMRVLSHFMRAFAKANELYRQITRL